MYEEASVSMYDNKIKQTEGRPMRKELSLRLQASTKQPLISSFFHDRSRVVSRKLATVRMCQGCQAAPAFLTCGEGCVGARYSTRRAWTRAVITRKSIRDDVTLEERRVAESGTARR